METAYDSFSDNIAYAKRQGRLSEPVALILLGRILHAVDTGDLTPAEMRALNQQLGDPKGRYADAFEMAAYEPV